jgi:hypothetical protein
VGTLRAPRPGLPLARFAGIVTPRDPAGRAEGAQKKGLPEDPPWSAAPCRWEGAPVTVGASLASTDATEPSLGHNTLWNHAALSVLEDLRGELSPAKCHQAIGRVN